MYSKAKQSSTALPKIGPVTLALQLQTGDRLIAEFRPEVSLWDILQNWESRGELKPPISSLTSDVPVCIYLRKEISTKKTLQATTLLQLGILNGKAAIRYSTKQPGITEQPHVGGIIAPTPRAPSPEAITPMETEIAEDINDVKMETSELSEIPMMEDKTMSTIPAIEKKEADEAKPWTGRVSETVDLQPVDEERAAEVTEDDIPPKNKSSEESKVQSDIEEQVNFLNEQGALVYLPPKDVSPTAQHQDESDEFFEHTEEEVRKMMHDLISQNNQLQSAPLITAQLRREQEEKRKLLLLQKYPTTVLRVHFSDAFILQLPLSSFLTLAEVKRQLLEYLDVSMKVDNFELFTTPPKHILETSLPLHELGLTPSSHVYISSNCILNEKFRLNPSSYDGAVRAASRQLYRPTTAGLSANDDIGVFKEQRPKRPAPEPSATATSIEKNVPKWLKLKR